jgi:hypothetical protein
MPPKRVQQPTTNTKQASQPAPPKNKPIKQREKASVGGKTIQVPTLEEYYRLIDYKMGALDLDEKKNWPKGWESWQKRNFIEKAEKLEVRDDGKANNWPEGKVLHMPIRVKSGTTTFLAFILFAILYLSLVHLFLLIQDWCRRRNLLSPSARQLG